MPHPLRNATTEGAVLGGIIAQLRAARSPEMAQQELAREMGLSASAWSRVEKGETELTALQLKKVAQVVGVDATTILELVDKMAKRLKEEAGIEVESTTVKGLVSGHAAAISSAGVVAVAVAGAVVPVIGPVLGGLLGAYMSARANKKD
jgi:transcriptional regulator with XRE-family HTH domain